MKVLVTGSSGFVGKELVKELLKRKAEVVEFDRSEGKDILNKEQIAESCKGCDAVMHLAAILEEDAGMQELRKVNVEGTKNVLEAAAKQRVKKFILLSSTGVYGDFKGKASEELEKNPSSNYEKSKAEAEELVLSYQEIMPVTIARSALVLGPNNYWKQIIEALRKGFPIIGDGENKWQTVYYKDLVKALVFLLYNNESENESYNIAEEPEKAPSLNGLVELFRKELGIEKQAKHVPKAFGILLLHFKAVTDRLKGKKTVISPRYVRRLLKNRNYSIEKIRKLGWKPEYSTEQAVKETVKELESRAKTSLDS